MCRAEPTVASLAGAGSSSTLVGAASWLPVKTDARLPKNPRPLCSSQCSVGCVPLAKYSLYTIERCAKVPFSSSTSTSSHPLDASLPVNRQTDAVVTPAGGVNHCGLSPRVATFM